jgi:hypothetical protein
MKRRWAYLILLLDDHFENDKLLVIIDFENYYSLAWHNYNISSICNWSVLEMDPNEWRQNSYNIHVSRIDGIWIKLR